MIRLNKQKTAPNSILFHPEKGEIYFLDFKYFRPAYVSTNN